MYVERNCSNCLHNSLNCLAKLPPEEQEYISSFKSSTFTKRGQVIFYEGRTPQGVYCLNEGKVKIYMIGNDGKEQVIRIITPTNFFGLRALISGRSYINSAVTLEDSVICLIPKRPFLKVIQKYPDVSHCLMILLSSMLGEAENKLMSLAQKPVRERLAETLLTLHEVFNRNGGNNEIILSRSDLANIVGTANETVIRILSEFRDEQLVSIEGRKITILNFFELRKIGRID
jgi:CRP-like cAMP-binding protein